MSTINHKIYQKILSFVTVLLLLFQSVVPSVVYAQEATDSATVEEVSPPGPDSEVSSATDSAVVDEVLPSPSPSVEPSATPTIDEQNIDESSEITEGQPNAPPSPSPTPEATPIVESTNSLSQGKINTVILENTDANSLELDLTQNDSSSASLSTDKADYAPTDTAVISGSDFPKEAQLNLIITADNYRFEIGVQTSVNGSFTYLYQLDGTYRPLYIVEAYDLSGALLASTSFTDSPISGCTNDSAGANDEPGQKDLTKMCVDYNNLPDSVDMDWNWDNSSWPGRNTGDGCSLFDTDGDGLVNYSLCVTVGGNPAAILTTTLYSCGDDRADRCTNPIVVLIPGPGTFCSASVTADDPFPAGSNYPNDTKANCSIDLDDVGGVGVAELVDVCSYPSSQPNSDPSDCIIFKDNTGRLEVVKDLIPTEDSGLFNLQIDSVTEAANVGDGGTTGEKVVTVGDHTVGETAGTNTSLESYSSSIVCKDLNGSGSIVAQSEDSGPLTVSIEEGEDIVCIITNTSVPSLTLVKTVVNDNGGTAVADDFQAYINGNPVDWNSAQALPTGNYTASEDTVSGYNASNWGEDCAADGTVSLALGEHKTCTITNDDEVAQITLIKVVSNSFGGDALSDDFNLTIDGNVVLSGSTTDVLANEEHVIDETQITGYTFVSISGDGKCPDVLGGSVTLDEGEHVTCYITNQDVAPTITLIKNVINDDGGTALPDDFNLTVDGSVVLSGAVTTVISNVLIAINETLLPGYNFVSITGDNKCPAVLGGTLTLDEGEDIICTITNDDIAPKLKLVKVVTNDNGGTATAGEWTLTASGDGGFADLGDSDNFHEVRANKTYTLSESGPEGYTATDWDCDGGELDEDELTLDLAEEVTCTIINDDNVPSLNLVKHVTNNNGGQAEASDWTLEASGPTSISGSGGATSDETFQAGTYTLSEDGPTGYTASDWECSGGFQNNDQITIGLGENVTCEITNDDNGPSLELIKHVVNDNGGSAQASDWTLQADGPTPISGNGSVSSDDTFEAGVYSLSEFGGPSGYIASGWTCSGGSQNGDQVTIGLGDTVICEITNDDIGPQLTVIKYVINDNGGTLAAFDFTMLVLGDNISEPIFAGSETGTTVTLDEGGYLVGEIEQDGYTMSTEGDCSGTISVGESKTCTIINDDESATLIVRKVVINDNGGTLNPEDFSFQVNEESAQSFEADGQNDLSVDAGTYTIVEPSVTGYTVSYDNCEDILIPNGGSATCTITNNDDAPSLTLIKEVVNDNGGQAQASEWTLQADGPTPISGNGSALSGTDFSAGTYTLSESGPDGYNASDWVCSGDGVQNGNQISLQLGESATCTIENDDTSPLLKLVKVTEGGNDSAGDWTLTASGDGGFSDFGDSGIFHEVLANEVYTLSEDGPLGYSASDWDCGEANLDGNQIVLGLDEEVTCTIINIRDSGTITVIKDVEPDDESLWDILIEGELSQSDTLGDGGQTGPHSLPTGTYTITEENGQGYVSSYVCFGDEEQEILSGSGRIIELDLGKSQNITCIFTNEFVPPVLTLTKTNNRLGQNVPPGSDVLYTLIVELTGSTLTDVILTDVLPNGFVYRLGSWTASSSERGDLKDLGVTPEPTYASPGVWQLGDMVNGETVTLTLMADIKGDIDLGLYKDLAFSVGTSMNNDEILANEDSGVFVGTEVNVTRSAGGESYEVERTEEKISEVLGAAIELPATGADVRWIMLATALFILGVTMTTAGLVVRRKYE